MFMPKEPPVMKAMGDRMPESPKIEETLQGLLGWVQQQKDAAKEPTPQAQPQATPAPATRTPTTPWGWVMGLIIAAVVFLGLAGLAWYLWSKGKELAKLRHEKDMAEMEKHTAEVQAELTILDEKREALKLEAHQAEGRIETLRMAIQRAEAERQAAHAKLDTLTSWDDVDKMIQEKQP